MHIWPVTFIPTVHSSGQGRVKMRNKNTIYSNYGNNARRQGKDECLLLSARLIYFCIKPISFLTGIFSKSSL